MRQEAEMNSHGISLPSGVLGASIFMLSLSQDHIVALDENGCLVDWFAKKKPLYLLGDQGLNLFHADNDSTFERAQVELDHEYSQ